MKSVLVLAMAFLICGSFAHAADTENSGSATTDTSKNPLTGTVTKTTKHKSKVKHKNGKKSEVEVTDKVKTKKNGEVEETIKADGDSKPATN